MHEAVCCTVCGVWADVWPYLEQEGSCRLSGWSDRWVQRRLRTHTHTHIYTHTCADASHTLSLTYVLHIEV